MVTRTVSNAASLLVCKGDVHAASYSRQTEYSYLQQNIGLMSCLVGILNDTRKQDERGSVLKERLGRRAHTGTERQKQREAERERETETEKQTHTERHRERERQRQRDRDRDSDGEWVRVKGEGGGGGGVGGNGGVCG